MKKYEVSRIKRIKQYKILFGILTEYSARHLDYQNDGREGSISFIIPKANALELDKRLEESGLVFRVLE